MARERSPNRYKAFQLWKESGGTRMLKDIAASLGVSDALIRKWKKADNWEGPTNGYVTNANSHVTDNSNGHVTVGHETEKKSQRGKGAPKGNQYAKGNRGGAAPIGNTNAVKHGLFRKFLPDDEETREIYDNVGQANPLDLLWESIQIKFTAIVRAQKIMFVRDQDDETKALKREKRTDTGWEDEYELQHAWDKQASFLQAQARAMATLTSMIRQYEEMCRLGFADEEQQLRIQKLKAEVKALDNPAGEGGQSGLDQLAEVIAKSAAAIQGDT
ncbi:phage terminase small subunit [Brevibacillus centrosporus]|uniref:phage terminase small subunit n=1 Tax=Brevibacillus centrosporus TaxID=54910 RepID=UPI003B026AB1